jgi:hypothetical protein
MYTTKNATHNLLTCFLLLFIFTASEGNAWATVAQDTSLKTPKDTDQITKKRIINRDFDEVYTQTLRLATFGQEFFDPHKTLLVSDLSANIVVLSTPKLPIFFVFTPRISIRLFAAQGAPVKSPSYMPGGTFYSRLNNDFNKPQFFSVSYTHHSNGIRGPTLNPNGTFNTDSGKFTTNFYTLTYYTGKRTEKEDLVINRFDDLALELHSALVGQGYSAALKGKYGFVRVNGDWSYNIAKKYPDAIDKKKKNLQNWQRLQFDFQYIADKYDDYNSFDFKKRLNVTLKYFYQFPFMRNASFYVGGGYRGQDEYNIFFQDSYPYMMVGVASGLAFDFRK